jgi:hypothetical protein
VEEKISGRSDVIELAERDNVRSRVPPDRTLVWKDSPPFQLGFSYLTDEPRRYHAAAERILINEFSLAPNNTWAHYWLGFVEVNINRAN